MTDSNVHRTRIVIVGGGFGGLHVARALADVDAELILLDRSNHHTFQPLLYQVATAGLSPADIATPIRRVLRRQSNVQVLMTEVTGVDVERRALRCKKLRGELSYDYLVLACGATHGYFGKEHWAEFAPGLKTVDDALAIRRRTLLAFEAAELEEDDDARKALLTFVVIGGGPTGVELAGALREIAVASIPRDFRRVDTSTARVVLVEAAPRLLANMSPKASELAERYVKDLGVELRLGTRVTNVDAGGVYIGDERLEAGNVVWAAGVRAAPIGASLGVELDGAGRVKVQPDCSIPGYPEVFVIGDLAAQRSADTGKPVPGVAQGAMQMGDFVGKLLAAELAGKANSAARPAFVYYDKGSMATIGVARAVADLGKRTHGGLFAWLLWCVVHVMFLVSFRNRFFVMLHWAYNYLAMASGVRLITGAVEPKVVSGIVKNPRKEPEVPRESGPPLEVASPPDQSGAGPRPAGALSA